VYSEKPLSVYLDHAASGNPTPGGGSVSALVGALGASMACMAANFTVGKKKFRHVEEECRAILERSEARRRELLMLTDADTEAYAKVSAAYAMPKQTPEEKAARSEAIQQALRVAMDVPLKAFRACAQQIEDLERLVEIANPNLISDVGVAAFHTYAGLLGCKLNVEINLAYIKDADFTTRQQQELDTVQQRVEKIKDTVVQKVYDAIR